MRDALGAGTGPDVGRGPDALTGGLLWRRPRTRRPAAAGPPRASATLLGSAALGAALLASHAPASATSASASPASCAVTWGSLIKRADTLTPGLHPAVRRRRLARGRRRGAHLVAARTTEQHAQRGTYAGVGSSSASHTGLPACSTATSSSTSQSWRRRSLHTRSARRGRCARTRPAPPIRSGDGQQAIAESHASAVQPRAPTSSGTVCAAARTGAETAACLMQGLTGCSRDRVVTTGARSPTPLPLGLRPWCRCPRHVTSQTTPPRRGSLARWDS